MGIGGQIRLTGTIILPTERQAELLPLLEEHIALSRAEPGCLEFSIVQDADRRDTFRLSELFRNQAAFEAHQQRTRNSAWGAATVDLQRNFEKTSV